MDPKDKYAHLSDEEILARLKILARVDQEIEKLKRELGETDEDDEEDDFIT